MPINLKQQEVQKIKVKHRTSFMLTLIGEGSHKRVYYAKLNNGKAVVV